MSRILSTRGIVHLTALAIVLALAGVPYVSCAAQLADSDKTKAPSLTSTVKWLQNDAKFLLSVDWPAGNNPWTHRSIEHLTVTSCRMSWADSTVMVVGAKTFSTPVLFSVPLADLDVGGVHAKTMKDDDVIVEFGPRGDRPPIRHTFTNGELGIASDTNHVVAFPARNTNDAERVVAALKHAAILCGARATF